MKKIDFSGWKVFGAIVGLLAILGLVGPFMFEFVYGLSAKCDMVTYVISAIFVLVNTLTILLNGSKTWRWCSIILSVVMLSFWLDNVILVGVEIWKSCTELRTGCIIIAVGMLAFLGITVICDFASAKKDKKN